MEAAQDPLSAVAVVDGAPAVRAWLGSVLVAAGARVVEGSARVTLLIQELATEEDLLALDAAFARDPLLPILALTDEPEGSPLLRAAIRRGVFGVLRKPLRERDVLALLDDVRAERAALVRFA